MDSKAIRVGRYYTAASAKMIGRMKNVFNDRYVVKIIHDDDGGDPIVEYSGPALATSVSVKRTTLTKFAKWAKEEVTDLMPNAGWRRAKVHKVRPHLGTRPYA